MATSIVTYQPGLRTEAVHQASSTTIVTDAPVDNHGKGEAFSPTDLFSTSLAACMLTIMGIYAESRNLELVGLQAEVTKTMLSNPRRVGKIEVIVSLKGANLSENERKGLEKAARACPVAHSLATSVEQDVQFKYNP